MDYAIRRTVEPTIEPVTTEEAKLFLKQDDSTDDDLIDGLIAAARQHVETYTGRALITQTWLLSLEKFPGEFVLPHPPLQSVTSVKYTDTDGVQQTLSGSTDYTTDAEAVPGRILLAYGQSWPTPRDMKNAVEATYVAGYGDAAADVPDVIKLAIKLLVAEWYENRAAVGQAPETVNRILGFERVWWVIQ